MMGLRSTTRWVIAAMGLPALGLIACATTETASAPSASTKEFREAPPMETSARSSLPTLQTVYFDLDRFEIRSDAKTALRENAKAIRDNKGQDLLCIGRGRDERVVPIVDDTIAEVDRSAGVVTLALPPGL